MTHSSSMENYCEMVELLVKYDRTFHAWSLVYAIMYPQWVEICAIWTLEEQVMECVCLEG